MGRTRTLEDQLPIAQPDVDLRVLSEGLADEDPAVREDCAQKLAAAKNPEAAPFLRHALDDDSEQVRVWGAYGLSMLARAEDRDELQRAAESDDSPLVRIWATFGRAQLGEDAAGAALVAFLDLPDLELKSNAADALLSLTDPSLVRPLLEKRLGTKDERKRLWAAAVLHRFGHKDAFAIWRDGLVNPETRVDAAMVAAHLSSKEAARELIRVTAELTQDELDAPVPAANDLPLAELLTSPLLELDLAEVLLAAKRDPVLRANLLLLVLRSPAADPEVLGQIYELAGSFEPAALGKDVAELLGEQEPAERLNLISRMVDFAVEAVLPTLDALPSEDRGALIDAVAEAAGQPTEENSFVSPLLEILRGSPFFEQLADLPDDPWGMEPQTDLGVSAVDAPEGFDVDEEDVAHIIERMVAGEEVSAEERKLAEETLTELGMTAAEFVESLNAQLEDDVGPIPPEPEQVASRALALAAVLERARLERALATKKLKPDEAQHDSDALMKWLDAEGLGDVLTSLEMDLLQAEPADWLDEDLDLAAMSVDALAILLWSAGVAPLPSPERPAVADDLLRRVPLLQPVDAFIAKVAMRSADELERQRELCETYLWRCEQESSARLVLAGEEVETEIDVEAILDELVKDGFDAKAAKAKGGALGVKAEALRFLGKKAAERLAGERHFTPGGGDFPFKGKGLFAISDDELAAATAMAHERHRAIVWVLEGGEWDDLSMEERPEDFDDVDGEDFGEESAEDDQDDGRN